MATDRKGSKTGKKARGVQSVGPENSSRQPLGSRTESDLKAGALRARGVATADRRKVITIAIRELVAQTKGRIEGRLIERLTASPLRLSQIHAVIEQLLERKGESLNITFELFTHQAPPPPLESRQQPQPTLRAGQVVDFLGESKKGPSPSKLEVANDDLVDRDKEDKELDLLPAQYRKLRDIQPDEYARLKEEVDALVPPASIKLLPKELPKDPPETWTARTNRGQGFFEWLDATWGPYIEAGLLDQTALGRLDESARQALFYYAKASGIDPASKVPSAFKKGDTAAAEEALRRGDIDEARRHASPTTIKRLRRRLADKDAPTS